MALVLKTAVATIECPAKLRNDINNDAAIVPTCTDIRVDNGVDLTFTFSVALSTAEDIQLDTVISALACNITAVSATVDQIQGTIFPLLFSYNSTTTNRWLSYGSGSSMSSDEIHAIIPFDCKLVSLVYSNEHDDVLSDVEMHLAAAGTGSSNAVVFTQPIRGIRTMRKSNFPNEVLFMAGDKLGIYCRHVHLSDTTLSSGQDPEDVVVVLYLQITAINNEEQVENYSGKF